jgi:nitric oxide reductase subunit B
VMGVFGMLAVALVVFGLRQISASDEAWAPAEKYVRVSFWGLNVGLMLMVILNLFPGGILQLVDVFNNGYWHARSPLFMSQPLMHFIEWLRMPADLVFIGFGVVPLLIAGLKIYIAHWNSLRRHEPLLAGIVPGAVKDSGD